MTIILDIEKVKNGAKKIGLAFPEEIGYKRSQSHIHTNIVLLYYRDIGGVLDIGRRMREGGKFKNIFDF